MFFCVGDGIGDLQEYICKLVKLYLPQRTQWLTLYTIDTPYIDVWTSYLQRGTDGSLLDLSETSIFNCFYLIIMV